MSTIDTSAFLIELDCLLDTRLSTIDLIDSTKTKDVIKQGYTRRDRDIFEGIDKDVFDTKYNNRNLVTLHNSIATPMVKILNEFASKTLKIMMTSPFQYHPKIILNTYPYILDDSANNTFKDMLRFITDDLADIEIAHYSYEDITPKFMKDNVSIAAMYHYYKWLEVHSNNDNFKKVTCPEVSILTPMLYFNDTTNSTGLDPFDSMVSLIEPLVGLKMFPAYYFSANLDGYN